MSNISDKQFSDANQEPVEYDGSPLSWRVSAYALVKKDSKILIIKNKLEKLYDVVGGGIEFGEDIAEALERECMEEGGAEIKMGNLLKAHVDWFYHRNGNYYQTLQLFYDAELVGDLQKPTESDVEWRDFVLVDEVGSKYRLPPIVEQVIKESS
ncbi:MAG: NUDIX domain-containing protein [Pseudomonadales bacterium]|nr:NUDIX domain-containing protein [Pseudomonadales bacterium]